MAQLPEKIRERTETISVREFAQRHSLGERTVWQWIADGRLRAVRLGPKTTRITEEEAEAFVRRCAQQ